MEFEEIMLYLEEHGSEQNRRIYSNHGIPEPKYGVKVSDLKKLQKIIKKDYKAKKLGDKIGKVTVDMGNTACKVPMIRPYIEKMEARGVKKKKQARC